MRSYPHSSTAFRSRFASFVLLLVPWLPACRTSAHPPDSTRSLELAAGPLDLPEESWAPLDGRVRGALTIGFREPGWPCGLEVGFQYARAESKDESVANGADFFDFRLGPALEWRPQDRLTFVVGAGARAVLARVTKPGTFLLKTEESSSIGAYAHAGAFVRVHGGFSIGLDGQWADGSDYDLLGKSRDAEALELLIALRWDL